MEHRSEATKARELGPKAESNPNKPLRVELVPLNEVKIPPQRQRQDLGDLEELADSIRRLGLINPIILDEHNVLVAGERRFHAFNMLSRTHIPVRRFGDLTQEEKYLLEFEENFRRKDLTWQEDVMAVWKFYMAIKAENEEASLEDIGSKIGMSKTSLLRRIALGEALNAGDETVHNAEGMISAFNYLQRIQSRAMDSELDSMLDIESSVFSPPAQQQIQFTDLELPEDLDLDPNAPPRVKILPPVGGYSSALSPFSTPDETILHKSFLEWSEEYKGEKFNLIHCDFPYGIGMHRSDQNQANLHWGTYNDREEDFFNLLESFFKNQAKFIAANAHIIFWLPMKRYDDVYRGFNNLGPEWKCDPYPLVWYKVDKQGIAPDAQRGFRHCYETALLITKGDRKIIRTAPNIFPHETPDKSEHNTQKPLPVVQYFFRALCDRSSRVLDPTCGSGTAIEAAIRAGAGAVLGMDISEEYTELCRRKVKTLRLEGL